MYTCGVDIETEINPSGGKKKFLKIAFGVVFVAGAVAVWYFFMQKDATLQRDATLQLEELAPVATEKKTYTQEEKLQILADLAKQAPKDTVSQAEKLRVLQTLSKQAPADTTISNEEKLRILQSLSSVNQ